MQQYHDLMRLILDQGTPKEDRTGTGTLSIFGHQMRFNLAEGFPLVTTKRLHLKSIIHELLWFLAGDTNVRYLQEHGVTIWDEWADKNGDLGPVYGEQWRSWPVMLHQGGDTYHPGRIDQLKEILTDLGMNPDSRRLVVSAWNVGELEHMALSPCHCLFQFNTRPIETQWRWARLQSRLGPEEAARRWDWDAMSEVQRVAVLDQEGVVARFLDLQLYQRSADVFLGVPFNIASYALLTHLVARHAGMVPGDFIHTLGDAHLYRNHLPQAREQLAREFRPLPRLRLSGPTDIFEVRFEDIAIKGYDPHPPIAAKVAV